METTDYPFSQNNKEQTETLLSDFDFYSDCHQRYQNGEPVMGLQKCPRHIRIRKNIDGCPGYLLTPGDGYILTATNGDTGQPQFAPKPLRVRKASANEILLQGYEVVAQTPFGWQPFDLSDYGLTIILSHGIPQRCILHMYDRNIDLEYRTTRTSTFEIEATIQF